MSVTYRNIEKVLSSNGWRYISDAQIEVATFTVNTSNGFWNCLAQSGRGGEAFLFLLVFPVKVPIQQRRECLETVNQINQSLLCGNFELNFETGEMRFRFGVANQASELSEKAMRSIIEGSIAIADKCFLVLLCGAFQNMNGDPLLGDSISARN
jgi:hypothetical protein